MFYSGNLCNEILALALGNLSRLLPCWFFGSPALTHAQLFDEVVVLNASQTDAAYYFTLRIAISMFVWRSR